MSDYYPISIHGCCNVSADVLGDGASYRLGNRVLRGLPFELGDAATGQLAMIGPSGHRQPVSIPLGRTALSLTFAHALTSTELLDGAIPGQLVAEYVVYYGDGTHEGLPIRERFEIGWRGDSMETRMAGQPFRALPDGDEQTFPRGGVDRDLMGRALTEVDVPHWTYFSSGPGATQIPIR